MAGKWLYHADLLMHRTVIPHESQEKVLGNMTVFLQNSGK